MTGLYIIKINQSVNQNDVCDEKLADFSLLYTLLIKSIIAILTYFLEK